MFSQTTEYALRAMSCLALRPDQLTSTPTLAKQTRVPLNYLSKVLQQLAAAKLVAGRRGVGGGYRLTRSPTTIRLTDVILAIGELRRIKTCPLGISSHGSNLCPLHRKLDQAVAAVESVLGEHTLQEIIDQPGANVPLCDTNPTAKLSVSARGKSGR